jgi:hypothetical protein
MATLWGSASKDMGEVMVYSFFFFKKKALLFPSLNQNFDMQFVAAAH